MEAASLNRDAIHSKKVTTGVVFAVLIVFYTLAIGSYAYNAIDKGYGSGLTNQQHVTPELIERLELQHDTDIPADATVAQLSDLTLAGDDDKSLWNELWRWAATIAALGALLAFWYFVISRLGPI